jgi:hypothetical protein
MGLLCRRTVGTGCRIAPLDQPTGLIEPLQKFRLKRLRLGPAGLPLSHRFGLPLGIETVQPITYQQNNRQGNS